MLLWRIIPSDVMEIVVHRGVLVVLGVAYEGLEVSLGRGDKICVVEEESPWQVVPTN